MVRPDGMSHSDFSKMRTIIQFRVINALKMWVEYKVDFKGNVSLQDQLLFFIRTVLFLDHPILSRPLRTKILSIRGVIQRRESQVFQNAPPPPIKSSQRVSSLLTVFDFDPQEIARQLTLIDFSLFTKIKPEDLLNQAWQKSKYKDRAINVLTLVDRMNNLTLWVSTTILSQKDMQKRAERLTVFIEICNQLNQMHNFCTLMAIVNGLSHCSIRRLKKTMAKVDRVNLQKLNELREMVSPARNFHSLREKQKVGNPCLPYLGLYMADLTFMYDGNPTFHSDILINFSKCRLIYHQIRDLILKQDTPYNFEEVPPLQDSLMNFTFLDDDTLYEVSLKHEPREEQS